eukprot:2573776-Pyramimonas_sp.AAC.1
MCPARKTRFRTQTRQEKREDLPSPRKIMFGRLSAVVSLSLRFGYLQQWARHLAAGARPTCRAARHCAGKRLANIIA